MTVKMFFVVSDVIYAIFVKLKNTFLDLINLETSFRLFASSVRSMVQEYWTKGGNGVFSAGQLCTDRGAGGYM